MPIKIKGSIDFGKSYLRGVNGDAVNIPAKGEFGKLHGFEIEANLGIDTFKPIVVSYTDFDGKKWENPELDEFKRIYEGKRLKDIKDGKKYVFYKDDKAKQPEKVEDKELPKDLDKKKFDEISKNIKAKSEISKEELEAYLAYIDAYENMYGIDDVYGYYGVDEVDPGEYNFDEYDFEDYGYEDESVESDTVEAGYQESSEESYDEPVTEESVETSIENETVEDFTNEDVTEEYIEPS